MLTGLTEEQNQELRKMHVESMDSAEKLKTIANAGDSLAEKLVLITLTQAQTYLELGDFESDPRFPK
jgi:hypothetical protein